MEPIGVIGVGRLGICTALVLEKAGFPILCYDVNKSTCDAINQCNLQSPEKGVTEMIRNMHNMTAVYSLKDMIHLNTFFCIVPTPSLPDGSYDHQYIEAVAEECIRLLTTESPRKIFNVCCTTMPGYCDSLQDKFTKLGLPVDVCYNPEFIAQGDILNGFYNPDIVLIGEANEACGRKLESIYKSFVTSNPNICRMSRTEAEITKISINCFITSKISFANTIGDLCFVSNCNQEKVLKAIGQDSRIGNKYFRWGFGFGGPCFPRDNRALCLYARSKGIHHLIGEATDTSNKNHCDFLVQHLIAMKGEREFVMSDLAYKPGTLILEESQSLAVALQLVKQGHTVYVQETPEMTQCLETQYPATFVFGTPAEKDCLLINNALTMFRV